MTHPTIIEGSKGDTLDLGTITLRLLAVAEQTNGAFAVGEFSGAEGPWTVPHVHQHTVRRPLGEPLAEQWIADLWVALGLPGVPQLVRQRPQQQRVW